MFEIPINGGLSQSISIGVTPYRLIGPLTRIVGLNFLKSS
jgi:hypothetical protein